MNRSVREKLEEQVIDAAITLLADYESPLSDRVLVHDAERRFAVGSVLLERAGLALGANQDAPPVSVGQSGRA